MSLFKNELNNLLLQIRPSLLSSPLPCSRCILPLLASQTGLTLAGSRGWGGGKAGGRGGVEGRRKRRQRSIHQAALQESGRCGPGLEQAWSLGDQDQGAWSRPGVWVIRTKESKDNIRTGHQGAQGLYQD